MCHTGNCKKNLQMTPILKLGTFWENNKKIYHKFSMYHKMHPLHRVAVYFFLFRGNLFWLFTKFTAQFLVVDFFFYHGLWHAIFGSRNLTTTKMDLFATAVYGSQRSQKTLYAGFLNLSPIVHYLLINGKSSA